MFRNLGKPSTVHPVSDGQTKKLASRSKVLDGIVLITCVMAFCVDQLFFYIQVINRKEKCQDLDGTLLITASVLRTFFDLLYIPHIIFQFQPGFIAPSSRVSGRGELIDDPVAIKKAIMKRYLRLIFQILSIIPLPQVLGLAVIPNLKSSLPFQARELLVYMVFYQIFLRIIGICRLIQVTITSDILRDTDWAGAAFNFFVYVLASHLAGAGWYLRSIESELRCWRQEMEKAGLFHVSNFGCGPRSQAVISLLNSSCPFIDPDQIQDPTVFNFGMYYDAVKSGVVDSTTDFPRRFFSCFWWGLRNLSSLGQNLKTSTDVEEIINAIVIAIYGSLVYSFFIGSMQKPLERRTVRAEEMKVKRWDTELWMSRRKLPEKLKERIRRYEQYKWQKNRGVEEEAFIHTLPKDLRKDIKRHLGLDLVKKLPMFEKMDEQLLDAMCDRLKPVLYPEKSYIVREGEPVDEMLFIMRGNLATMTTNGGTTGFFNSFVLKSGDFCGEELITWALDPNSSTNLPISTRTVETMSEVEAFALMSDDLKFVASQFRRLHSKQLQPTFRFYSMEWKTWAACFIQLAWRRYWKKKVERSLREAEDRLQDALVNENGSSLSLSATIYASRFAVNALRNLRKNSERNRMPQRLLPLLPPKPAELDFSTQKH